MMTASTSWKQQERSSRVRLPARQDASTARLEALAGLWGFAFIALLVVVPWAYAVFPLLAAGTLLPAVLIHAQRLGRPYEVSRLELFKSAYQGPHGLNRCNTESLFCSELVAMAHQHLGLLDHGLPCNEYTPACFSAKADAKISAGLLSEEIYLKKA